MTSNAKLYGLILSGGKSTRMGEDKGLIAYHGKPQREYLYDLLSRHCERTFLSLRENQSAPPNFDTISDAVEIGGPFNGMLSAHQEHPDAAFLVLACDMPMLDDEAIRYLIANRSTDSIATAFASKESNLPEPLCAIWEPTAFEQVLRFIQEEQRTCPRKYLIRQSCHLVYPKKESWLMNANDREEYQKAMQLINP